MKCCDITSETSMSHSAILDTTLHKTVLKFMLKIISVWHYKKQSILLCLAKEGIARFLGIMMKVLTPRTLEMSLQTAPSPLLWRLQFLVLHVILYSWVYIFISLFLYFSYLMKCCDIIWATSMCHRVIFITTCTP